MFWGGPHGFDCHTQTVPMRCRDCQQRIFFFRCNHGSRVVFDELGPPWPQHDCDRSWAPTRRRTVDERGRMQVEIAPGITVVRLPEDFGIDDDVIDLAHRASAARSRSRQRSGDIVRQDPTRTADDFYVGTIREITRSVDPLEHFRMSETTMARAGLQKLGRQDVGRLTVHVPFGEDIESYTAWIPTVLLEEEGVERAATVEVRLVGLNILSPRPTLVWFCSSLELLFV